MQCSCLHRLDNHVQLECIVPCRTININISTLSKYIAKKCLQKYECDKNPVTHTIWIKINPYVYNSKKNKTGFMTLQCQWRKEIPPDITKFMYKIPCQTFKARSPFSMTRG